MGIEMSREKSIEFNNSVNDYLVAVEDDALPQDILNGWKNDLITELKKYNINGDVQNMLYMLDIN